MATVRPLFEVAYYPPFCIHILHSYNQWRN